MLEAAPYLYSREFKLYDLSNLTPRPILFTIGNTAQIKAHGLLEYYSVSLPKKSRQGVSLTLIYLYNLTKNLAAQSAHLNYAVLP